MMFGLSTTAFHHFTTATGAFSQAGTFAWACGNQVYINGKNNPSHGGWSGSFKVGDLIALEFNPQSRMLTMKVARLPNQTFSIAVTASVPLYWAVDPLLSKIELLEK